jgi:hypothetical protein
VLRGIAGQAAAHGIPVIVVTGDGERLDGLDSWPGLTTSPVPDLSAVRGDPGELAGAAAATAWSLAEAAGVAGDGRRDEEGRRLLATAAEALAHSGEHGLDALRGALGDTDGSGSVRNRRLAREMADALGRTTESTRTGPAGTEAAQLLPALYPWVRSHPAGDGALAGLVVLDDVHVVAAPGAGAEVLLHLLAHVRRHGYGVVLGTASPRDLDPRLARTAAVHVLGLLHAPVQVEAARDLARARAGDAPDVARLAPGTLAVATEDTTYEVVRWRDA